MLHVAVALGSLCAEVDHVATEKKVVSGRDGHGVAHESGAVADESGGHRARDTVVEVLVSLTLLSQLNPAQAHPMEWICPRATYISGSFWVSMTAAMGIPKLEAGPQKSAQLKHPSANVLM